MSVYKPAVRFELHLHIIDSRLPYITWAPLFFKSPRPKPPPVLTLYLHVLSVTTSFHSCLSVPPFLWPFPSLACFIFIAGYCSTSHQAKVCPLPSIWFIHAGSTFLIEHLYIFTLLFRKAGSWLSSMD
jgi:hypothetical protein